MDGSLVFLCLLLLYASWVAYCGFSDRPRWLRISDQVRPAEYVRLEPEEKSLLRWPMSSAF